MVSHIIELRVQIPTRSLNDFWATSSPLGSDAASSTATSSASDSGKLCSACLSRFAVLVDLLGTDFFVLSDIGTSPSVFLLFTADIAAVRYCFPFEDT